VPDKLDALDSNAPQDFSCVQHGFVLPDVLDEFCDNSIFEFVVRGLYLTDSLRFPHFASGIVGILYSLLAG
jgi:hypothetical protein